MKYFLILPFLVIYSYCNAQYNLLGKSIDQVKEAISKAEGFQLLKSERNEAGYFYLSYKTPADNIAMNVTYFFDKEKSLCDNYFVYSETENLPSFVSSLNKSSIKTGDNSWITKNMEVEIFIEYKEGNSYFSIRYTKP